MKWTMLAGIALVGLVAAPRADAEEGATTVVLDYHAFGPQAAAWQLLGHEWWQWQAHGDSRPGTSYDVKVVVYRGIDRDAVAAAYPVVSAEQKDYRYVTFDAALAYLDREIAKDVLPELTEELRELRRRLARTPTDALRRRFAGAVEVAPDAVVAARSWRAPGKQVTRGIVGILAGVYLKGGESMGALVPLSECGEATPCAGEPRLLGHATFVAPRYVVDLAGDPRRIDLRSFSDSGIIDVPARATVPALVVGTTMESGPRRESERAPRGGRTVEEATVFLLSLSDGLQRTYLVERTRSVEEDGSGMRVDSMSLQRGDGEALDIVLHEQRVLARRSHCLRPAPTKRSWTFDGGSYREARSETPPAPGCR